MLKDARALVYFEMYKPLLRSHQRRCVVENREVSAASRVEALSDRRTDLN